MGRREYQRAFVDFFEDQLVQKRYEWREVLEEFLYGGKQPLINGIISGREYTVVSLVSLFQSLDPAGEDGCAQASDHC